MSIESILRQKGTDVVTIDREASIKRAADWLCVKNIGALVVTSGKVEARAPSRRLPRQRRPDRARAGDR
jgi:hypothetical protein